MLSKLKSFYMPLLFSNPCLTLSDPMDCSTPGLPVPHHLLKSSQVHVHCISDVIQTSHPLMLCSPSALNLSQNQRLFQWDSCSYHDQNTWVSASASVLPTSIQGWFPLRLTGLISLQFRDSQESSPAPQFKGISSSAFCLLYAPALTTVYEYWNKHNFG